MRLVAYGALSTSLAAAVILTAFQQRPNFYSACVYLSQSNASLMCLTNMGVFLTILLGHITQRIFFGHLRAIEEAHLRERTWFAVTETFLAMTVFRDEFNTRFVVMFVSLLFVKCFHWICHDRIDYVCNFLLQNPDMARWSNSLQYLHRFMYAWCLQSCFSSERILRSLVMPLMWRFGRAQVWWLCLASRSGSRDQADGSSFSLQRLWLQYSWNTCWM